jgi:opacity protein-like surface antigen
MKSYLKYSAAAIGLLFASSAASAADLPPPPLPAPAAWSFSVFGGASWLNDFDSNLSTGDAVDIIGEDGVVDTLFPRYNWNGDASFDTGFLVGGTIGYTFVDWARTELEISYANYDLNNVDISYRGCGNTDCEDLSEPSDFSLDGDGSLGILTIMGNMWLGFNMLPVVGDPVNNIGSGLGFSPYFGGGLGVAFVDGSTDDVFDIDDSSTAFAWQVGAGIRWNFASNIGLDVGYRYRGINDVSFDGLDDSVNLTSNNVIVGLTFSF